MSSSSRVINGERSFRLTATISPDNAESKSLSWISSDEKVATVKVIPNARPQIGSILRAASDPAVITAEVTIVGKGKADIIVKAQDGSGVQAVCSVEVRSTVGNATLPDARIYATDGGLYLSLPQAVSIQIYNLSGTLVRMFNASAGNTFVTLSSGTYVVRAGERIEKVMVK